MTDLDQRWQRAIRAHADRTEPTPEAWAAITARAGDDHAIAGMEGTTPTGRTRWMAAAVVVVLALGALAVVLTRSDGGTSVTTDESTTTTTTPAEPLVEAIVMVLSDGGGGDELCVIGSSDAFTTEASTDPQPPSCLEGIPIEGWDWDAVEDERTEQGTTWGHFHLTGRFVEDRFVLAEGRDTRPGEMMARNDDDPLLDPDRFATPCPNPLGGWQTPDPSRTTEDDKLALMMAARAEPDFGEVWIDEQIGVPGATGVMIVSFTGDLDRHRRELEAIWGGPLCVTEAPIASVDLRAAAGRLEAEVGGLEPIGDVDPFRGVMDDAIAGRLIVSVLIAPPGAEEEMAERYGVPVVLEPIFVPVG
jgi:hypothetical protein